MRALHLIVLALLVTVLCSGKAHAREETDLPPLKDWAVGILAADWRDSNGAPIEAFENARLALGEAFVSVGFDPQNIASMSLRPDAQNGRALASDIAFATFGSKARAAQAGCLLYFTSHGSPDGIVLGREGLLAPARLNGLIEQWCGERPTVVIVSACFSGAFIPALSTSNRMVMTASRADRSSFGCDAGAQYPYFDGCILESLPGADDFIDLSSRTRSCVARREYVERLQPASEPQTEVGEDVETMFIFLNFEHAAP